jgi:hypothetical protein
MQSLQAQWIEDPSQIQESLKSGHCSLHFIALNNHISQNIGLSSM